MRRSASIARTLERCLSSGAGRGRGINAANYPLGFSEAPAAPAPQPTPGAEEARPLDYAGVGRVRCYNCGQMGHVSYACGLPQVRKACYTCGNAGHVSRECPQRSNAVFCYYCREPGHVMRECPTMAARREPAGGADAESASAPQ